MVEPIEPRPEPPARWKHLHRPRVANPVEESPRRRQRLPYGPPTPVDPAEVALFAPVGQRLEACTPVSKERIRT